MFNLLPEILKEEIKLEYKKHLIIIVLIFVLFIQISFLVLIFPTWIISIYRERGAVSDLQNMHQKLGATDLGPIASVINETNTKLNIINSVMQYPAVLPIVNTIITKKTSDVRINEIYYNSTGASEAAVTLRGISNTREDLVSFVKNLENSKVFKEVNLPVSNFAKDKNISFSISMKISP